MEKKSGSSSKWLYFSGKGETTIITDSCEWPEEIDIERAEAAKERAENV